MVEAPDHESGAGPNLVRELIETWPRGEGARERVGEDSIAPRTCQSIMSKWRVLKTGRDTGVPERMSFEPKRTNSREVGVFRYIV